jgi:hypothetical protein
MTTKHINYHLLRKDPVSIQWDPKIRNTHSPQDLGGEVEARTQGQYITGQLVHD